MANADGPVYLSKDGNVFGPYTSQQIEEMKRNGEYRTYSWIWDTGSSNWVPINPPNKPPSPPGATASSATKEITKTFEIELDGEDPDEPKKETTKTIPTSRPGQSAGASKSSAPTVSVPGIPAIAHNNQAIVSGTLAQLSGGGCVFRSEEPPRQLPEFHKGGKLKLNVLEESSGKSENLVAVIQKVVLHDGHWDFHLTWDRVPVILEHLSR